MDDEHKGTISQRHEEVQEANFSIGRPKVALLKEVQPKHGNAGPGEEGAEERVQVQLSPKAVLVDEATSERNQVAARSPPSERAGDRLTINTAAAVAAKRQPPPRQPCYFESQKN